MLDLLVSLSTGDTCIEICLSHGTPISSSCQTRAIIRGRRVSTRSLTTLDRLPRTAVIISNIALWIARTDRSARIRAARIPPWRVRRWINTPIRTSAVNEHFRGGLRCVKPRKTNGSFVKNKPPAARPHVDVMWCRGRW